MTNQTRLIWKSGDVVKQGDTSSVFKLELRTNDNAVLNGPATIQLIHASKGMIEFEAEVVDSVVSFRLEKALPIGNYIIEVEHAGYVFPSTDSVTLTVNENLGDIITDEIAELLSVDEYISRKLADFQAGQIDLDELASKIVVPQYDDSQIRSQIADILAKIGDLKQSEGNQSSYDDSELKSRLTALENRTDNDTIYDDTVVNQRLTALESRPVGQSYDDTAVKQRLTALEQSSGTGSASVRRAPMSYTLDRTTNPWTVYFDNGCSLVIKNGAASELPYWYNYGQMPSATQALTENFIPFQIVPALWDMLSVSVSCL